MIAGVDVGPMTAPLLLCASIVAAVAIGKVALAVTGWRRYSSGTRSRSLSTALSAGEVAILCGILGTWLAIMDSGHTDVQTLLAHAAGSTVLGIGIYIVAYVVDAVVGETATPDADGSEER